VAAVVADGVEAGELVEFCKDNLASFKKPKRVEFVPSLPKNAYGKVLRRELRERFASVGVEASPAGEAV
jgi:acyl-coenzyme A synthetase/AMP-(fatty) acid ligase